MPAREGVGALVPAREGLGALMPAREGIGDGGGTGCCTHYFSRSIKSSPVAAPYAGLGRGHVQHLTSNS